MRRNSKIKRENSGYSSLRLRRMWSEQRHSGSRPQDGAPYPTMEIFLEAGGFSCEPPASLSAECRAPSVARCTMFRKMKQKASKHTARAAPFIRLWKEICSKTLIVKSMTVWEIHKIKNTPEIRVQRTCSYSQD